MRISALVLLAIPPIVLGACGSPPPPVAAPSAAKQSVSLPPAPPAPLVDPPGLVDVTQPANGLCEIAGKNDFDLAATADGPALFHVATGPTKLTIGSQGEAFATAETPSFTIRGFVAHDPSGDKSLVYAAKWLSFGGVYFPGMHDALPVTVHDGKISVTAPDDRGFHFAGDSGTLDVTCDALGLSPDVNGVLRNGLPPAFEKHDGKLSVLNYTKSVSLSAAPDGPAVGTFDVKNGPATVTVIERKGKKAHIRTDHFIGWVNASALKPFTRKNMGPSSDMQMLAAIGGVEGGVLGSSHTSGRTSTLVCTADVRILVIASASATNPFVIGTIPAGKSVNLTSRDDDTSNLVLDDDPKNPRVLLEGSNRFVVSNKDLASCTATTDARPVMRNVDDNLEMVEQANEQDAIDALPVETPKKATHANSIAGDPPKGLGSIGIGTPLRPETQELSQNPIDQIPKPIVRIGTPSVDGNLSTDVVTRVIHARIPMLAQCYDQALKSNPTIRGHFTVELVIDPTGKVQSMSEIGGDLTDPVMRQCVGRRLLQFVFPAPKAGVVKVSVPLMFNPANG